jgi:flavin reductase (DIM6/NTAB) family NADH-FMN oxidoreductase RutF
MTTAMTKETLGKALGRIVSGIYVVTAGSGEQQQGILASWIMQASFEPPRITLCVQQDREILKLLSTNKNFVVNVLSDENSNLMGRFAKYKPDQFDGLDLADHGHGPILNDAVAYLCCEVKEQWTAGDHDVILAEVVEGEILNPDLHPWTHLRKNGFSY